MLSDRDVAATVAVSDIERAKAFYSDTLGLPLDEVEEGAGVLVYRSGRAQLIVYRSDYAGTNQATAATWAAGQQLDEIVAALRKAGVTFEKYDIPGVTVRDGIHDFDGRFRGVWFKDPDGNILHVNNG